MLQSYNYIFKGERKYQKLNLFSQISRGYSMKCKEDSNHVLDNKTGGVLGRIVFR